MTTQTCHTEGCEIEAAFGTRTKPTWCETHIAEMFAERGLDLLETFARPTDHLLTRCRDCGCETHVRFEYVLGLGDRHGCGACRLRDSAEGARRVAAGQYEFPDLTPVDLDLVRSGADSNDYDYLGPLTDPSLTGDPHHVRCRTCKRLSAECAGDIASGCSCRVNAKRAQPVKRRERKLLRDSEDPATAWWAHHLNDAADWESAPLRGARVIWWRCPEEGHKFERKVNDMTGGHPNCPACREQRNEEHRALRRRYEGVMVSEVPELMALWDDEGDPATSPVVRNGDEWPYIFPCGRGHRRPRGVVDVLDDWCTSCRAIDSRLEGQAHREPGTPAAPLDPEIRAQWHQENSVPIEKVGANSRRMIRWLCQTCGHDWIQQPREREKRYRLLCPECNTKLGSLAAFYPELADQWAESNPTTPWHIVPNQRLDFTPTWVCPENSEHVWQATNVSRVSGSQCPQCRVPGKSRIELELFAAVRERFSSATSGTPISSPAFSRRRSWRPDIVVERDGGTPLVVEYDGAYWHASKVNLDREKSLDLLAAGYAVCRVREGELPSLAINNPQYMELRSHPTAVDVNRLATDFVAWVLGGFAQLAPGRPSTDERR
ncbi:zinc-ribbon domain-containing protein [Brachybacterium sp. GCM10030267]|uniref:zinc-ribbon domain-containing protein n=1 Tax=Brachybacterium sp. GCM10030267 TaxID=3273381 RepID=UPI003609A1DB